MNIQKPLAEDDAATINMTLLFGHVTLHDTHRWDGTKLILGGFSRHYDRHGNLEYETKPTEHCSMTFDGIPQSEVLSLTRILIKPESVLLTSPPSPDGES